MNETPNLDLSYEPVFALSPERDPVIPDETGVNPEWVREVYGNPWINNPYKD